MSKSNNPSSSIGVAAMGVFALLAMLMLAFFDSLGIPAWFQADPENRAFFLAGVIGLLLALIGLLVFVRLLGELISSVAKAVPWMCPVYKLRGMPCPHP